MSTNAWNQPNVPQYYTSAVPAIEFTYIIFCVIGGVVNTTTCATSEGASSTPPSQTTTHDRPFGDSAYSNLRSYNSYCDSSQLAPVNIPTRTRHLIFDLWKLHIADTALKLLKAERQSSAPRHSKHEIEDFGGWLKSSLMNCCKFLSQIITHRIDTCLLASWVSTYNISSNSHPGIYPSEKYTVETSSFSICQCRFIEAT